MSGIPHHATTNKYVSSTYGSHSVSSIKFQDFSRTFIGFSGVWSKVGQQLQKCKQNNTTSSLTSYRTIFIKYGYVGATSTSILTDQELTASRVGSAVCSPLAGQLSLHYSPWLTSTIAFRPTVILTVGGLLMLYVQYMHILKV